MKKSAFAEESRREQADDDADDAADQDPDSDATVLAAASTVASADADGAVPDAVELVVAPESQEDALLKSVDTDSDLDLEKQVDS